MAAAALTTTVPPKATCAASASFGVDTSRLRTVGIPQASRSVATVTVSSQPSAVPAPAIRTALSGKRAMVALNEQAFEQGANLAASPATCR